MKNKKEKFKEKQRLENSSTESSASTEKLLKSLGNETLVFDLLYIHLFRFVSSVPVWIFIPVVAAAVGLILWLAFRYRSRSLSHTRIHAPTKIENDEILMVAVFPSFWLAIVVSRTK